MTGISTAFAGSALTQSATLDTPAPEILTDGMTALPARANSPGLAGYRTSDIKGSDLPWTELGLALAPGQQVTFLLAGRMWVSREHDLRFEPGMVFQARIGDGGPLCNPMLNTGSLTVTWTGSLEVARSAGEWADDTGTLLSHPDI